MAPESCQEAEEAEKEASLSLVDQEPVNGHLEPPAGTPQEPVAPTCPQDTKPSSPSERSARNQEKFLQNQVQKLTLCTLLEQEKSQLEERLLQTMTTMQQLEAELQAFQKSCLLQLARSSCCFLTRVSGWRTWTGTALPSGIPTSSSTLSPAQTKSNFAGQAILQGCRAGGRACLGICGPESKFYL